MSRKEMAHHEHTYWYVELRYRNHIRTPRLREYNWLVAADKHEEAIVKLTENGMLPDWCYERGIEDNRGQFNEKVFSLDPHVVEWEVDGTMARLF